MNSGRLLSLFVWAVFTKLTFGQVWLNEFDINKTFSTADQRVSIVESLRKQLKDPKLQNSKELWFYDCDGGRVIHYNQFKKLVLVVIDAKADTDKCDLIFLKETDFFQLGIDIKDLKLILHVLRRKHGMSGDSYPFALKATSVFSRVEVVSKLNDSRH